MQIIQIRKLKLRNIKEFKVTDLAGIGLQQRDVWPQLLGPQSSTTTDSDSWVSFHSSSVFSTVKKFHNKKKKVKKKKQKKYSKQRKSHKSGLGQV